MQPFSMLVVDVKGAFNCEIKQFLITFEVSTSMNLLGYSNLHVSVSDIIKFNFKLKCWGGIKNW